ncbi:MAG: HAMP domain-containing protein [Candidatus Eisenbacteria bacterium]|nr:HAMP domain-containing protein [Candidatus Eisenbacteria bacterium]
MIRSLRSQLFVATAIVLLLTMVALLVSLAGVERRWLQARNAESLQRTAREVALVLRDMGSVPADTLAARLGAADAAGNCRITLIASDGRVVADSRADASTLENHAARPEVRAALAGGAGVAVRHSQSLGVDLQYAAVPMFGAAPWAVVRVAEPLEMVRALDRSLLRVSALAVVIVLLASFLLAFWVSGRFASRVGALEAVSARIGAGDISVRALELPADELGRLGSALNRMSAELRDRLGALERERDEREHILAHMTDGVALLDATNHLVHANASFVELLGAVGPVSSGAPFAELVRAPELEDLLTRARSGQNTVEADLRLWSPRQRFVRAVATRLDAERGEVLLVLHDLTEVERVHRIRQDFVANVSHELRTPLTSLRGYAETLLDGGLEDEARREGFVRVIRDQAERLQALVDDLLSLAELERPEAGLRAERFDLRALLARQVGLFRAAADRAGLALVLEEGEPLELAADRARLEQVVANLLDNAVKYTERGGITVRAGEEGGRVWCEVEDTGPGVPPDDQSRVFERFYRVDKARSRDKGGTGLGLSIVKHILALHRGEVSLRSEPGAGSTFRFELPRT